MTATLAVGEDPSGIAVSPDAIWVAREFSGTVVRIDPRGPVVAQTIHAGERLADVAAVRDAVWVVVHARSAHRGGTLRIAAAVPRLDSIDPAAATMLFPPELLGMTNDGLVTLNHAPGPRGSQLVPDLARSLPSPGDRGRSYRFQLRPGMRYSTGEPIRPEDFRRAIERDFRIGSPGAAAAGRRHRRPAGCGGLPLQAHRRLPVQPALGDPARPALGRALGRRVAAAGVLSAQRGSGSHLLGRAGSIAPALA